MMARTLFVAKALPVRLAWTLFAALAIVSVLDCSSHGRTNTPDAGLDATPEAGAGAGGGLLSGSGPLCSVGGALDSAADTILIDGASAGRVFDFIGGLSGGGGTSRLLYDYPVAQQGEILDYLFKPGFGASLELLKVEIGADTDTTNGAEASHSRTPTDQNYHRGYEWWLMQQAKARNPQIKLYALEWGAPGWFNGGFFSQDNIDYIVRWIQNAEAVYGLSINYVGGWNENGYSKAWVESLKAALVAKGLSTEVVSADAFDTWAVAADMNGDAAFHAAVDIVGTHYPCGYQSLGLDCGSAPNLSDALATGKRLWASEEGSLPFDDGAIAMARAYNRHYIQAKITGSINWSLVGSWYANLPYGGVDGLLYAGQPWSGYYVVDRQIWVTAHTTQFVRPGWHYLDTGSAVLDGVGSYVALKAPNSPDWSLVLETLETGLPHTLQFAETGGVFASPVHVWATDLASSEPNDWFVQQPDITPSACEFSFTALPNHLYTFTSTSGQGKGATTPPASAALQFPYSDDFESYTVGAMPNIPKYISALQGAFEVESCAGGRSGKCLQQEVTSAPIAWGSVASPDPVAFVGDPHWADFGVSVDGLLQQSGSLDLIGRITSQSQSGGGVLGYHLRASDSGTWTLFSQDAGANNSVLASGTAPFPLNTWHTLALGFKGSTITAALDGATIATVVDTTYKTGSAGLSVSKWNNAQFDNLAFTGGPVSDVGTGVLSGTPTACTATPPTPVAGVSLITDFSGVAPDAGAGAGTSFGSGAFGGGSYFYPALGPGVDSLANPQAGNYCTTLASQNSFVATATPGKGLVLSGQVATFTGIGLYLSQCVDASAFQGIEFTISGNIGSATPDGGTPGELTFSVSTPVDSKVQDGAGNTCTLNGCSSPSYTFSVPAQPTTLRVTWEMLTGGTPIFVLNPGKISGIQWSLPWPCTTNPVPYAAQIVLSDVSFF